MRVDILESSGFCGGVNRAIKILDKTIEQYRGKTIYLLGEIVHNKIVNQEYLDKGCVIISESDLDKLSDGSIVVSSAHGISNELRNKLNRFILIDSTCPFVKKNQDLILNDNSNNIFFIGKKNHSEAIALTTDKSIPIIENISDLNNYDLNNGVSYCQTTFNKDDLELIKKKMLSINSNFIFHNTLCEVTIKNQSALTTVNNKYNKLIIVGDKHSNNALSLYEMSKYKNTLFISNEDDLDMDSFNNDDSILIIGSASTPKSVMEKVKKKLLLNH